MHSCLYSYTANRNDKNDGNHKVDANSEFEKHIILGNITVTVPVGLEIHINQISPIDMKMNSGSNLSDTKSLGLVLGPSSGALNSNDHMAISTSAFLCNIPQNSHILIR
jgi:hypothetical protein